MTKRFLSVLVVGGLALLMLAPATFAADGVGLGGRTTDKDVTLWGFGVMAFFTVLVIGLSILQGRLDSRKDRARAEIERLRRD